MRGGVIRLLAAAGIGGLIGWLGPRDGFLATTQEFIGFLSLLMAGLLPAMILTATILRGTGMSAKRVDAYGLALRQQLRFWAVLFTFAGLATTAIIVAKIYGTPAASFEATWSGFHLSSRTIETAAWIIACGSIAVVLQRLWPAYTGLISLLELNVTMAKGDALIADRARIDALAEDARELAQAAPPDRLSRSK